MLSMEATSNFTLPGFFANKSVFLTGATGYVGRALLEKILRGCPEVAKVFVLVRGEHGKSPEERINEILGTTLFQRVRDMELDLLKKVIPVSGDVTFDGLGISPEDSLALREEISVVIHSAANVNFGAGLKELLKANLEGTQNTLEWAKQLTNLKAFVYISTAFSNSDQLKIEEKVYPTRIDPRAAMKLYSVDLPEALVDAIIPQLLGDHKLEYTFTKNLAEGLIQESRFDLPVCIVRPAVVGPAYQEPFPGWIDNFKGFTGGFHAMSKGIVRVFYTNKSGTVDIVPIDLVVNLTIAAAMSRSINQSKEVQVFNCSTSDHPYVNVKDIAVEAIKQCPPNKIYWYPSVIMVRSRLLARILDFFLHYMLALIADGVLVLIGKRPKTSVTEIYDKMKKLEALTLKLVEVEYDISIENTKDLYKKLTPEDQDLFNFDICGVNQNSYIQRGVYGLRRYAAGEKDEHLPAARENMRRYYWYYMASWGVFFLIVTLLIRLFA
ncbi:unnamed protein product [Allacma fusca]|uniref:Fatty acyl-CoA reductase n=1 Tax=Allacma fusca TaxID=39272 RepID=A0A8J2P1C1_9HEXA|nr:unnamed protein product [Allacma fusca]